MSLTHTNAQLAQQMNDLLAAWDAREAQFRTWVGGTATGGPNNDGRYLLQDAAGNSYLIESPAKLADLVAGPAGVAAAARDDALGYVTAAQAAQSAAEAAATAAGVSLTGAQSARDLALTYRDQAASERAAADASATAAASSETAAASSESAAASSETNAAASAAAALVSELAAAASASAAATFDPTNFYTKTQSDGLYKAIGYVPTWSEITGKPSTFAPSAHTHLWADITDKPATFTPSAHSHSIGDVSGLQGALDEKLHVNASAAGSVLVNKNTGLNNNSLQYWNEVSNPTLNPDTNWWYGIRMAHGDADTYYSATLAVNFFSDSIQLRRKVGGADQPWVSLWHSGNFDPNSYLLKSGGTINGALTVAGGDFQVGKTGGAVLRLYDEQWAVGIESLPNAGGGTNMVFKTHDAERMRIDGNGNVGIGGTPTQKLDVQAPANSVQARFGSIVGRGLVLGNEVTLGTTDAGSYLNALGAGAGTLIFKTENAERVRIKHDGNVGIGTSNPLQKLDVNGFIRATQALVVPSYNQMAVVANDGDANWGFGFESNGAYYYTQAKFYGVGDDSRAFRVMDASSGLDLLKVSPAGVTVRKNSTPSGVPDSASIILSNRNTGINGGIMGGIFADTYRDVRDPHYSGGIWFTRNQTAGNLSSSSDIVFGCQSEWDAGLPTERMRIGQYGITIGGSGGPSLSRSGDVLRHSSVFGWGELGAQNGGYFHMITDRPNFYMNTGLEVNGVPKRYTEGAMLWHGSASHASGRITVSTSAPSGGADGDVWFKV